MYNIIVHYTAKYVLVYIIMHTMHLVDGIIMSTIIIHGATQNVLTCHTVQMLAMDYIYRQELYFTLFCIAVGVIMTL